MLFLRRVLIVLLAASAVASGTVASAQVAPEAVRVDRRVELLAGSPDAGTFIPPPRPPVTADGTAAAAGATVAVSYDPWATPPPAARTAIEAALNVWSTLVTSSQPVSVFVSYLSIGPGVLASAGPTFVFKNFRNAPMADTYYPQPLAEALSGQNLGGSEPDIDVDINVRSDWYFGTDGRTPGGRYDLMSVVMHELTHGLGFLGTMTVSAGRGRWGILDPTIPGDERTPDIYDRWTEDRLGRKLLDTSVYPNPSTQLADALQTAVYFNSPFTNRSSSDRIQLWAPFPWDAGSSYAHFDEDAYPAGSANSLPTPYLNSAEAVHSPGPLTLCVLEALGWQTPETCSPPAPTATAGFTWYTNGELGGTGPSGSTVRAFAAGAVPGRAYRLVSGLDGGRERPCMWSTLPINSKLRVASASGFIGTTAGTINRGPGKWQVCFREEGTGVTLAVTVPATFTVT